jgi:RNA polymerase sigma-70 factor, ECF subfamily
MYAPSVTLLSILSMPVADSTPKPAPADGVDFDQLVEDYYQNLYKFGYSLAKNEADATDLTQQTFYRYATKGHQLNDKSKVKTWLFTTLYREFLGTMRRNKRFTHVELEQAGAELPSVSPGITRQLDGNSAVEALAQLEERYRAPLALFYLEDLSYKEIAGTLDIPIGTVMSRLSRGKEQLRSILTETTIS